MPHCKRENNGFTRKVRYQVRIIVCHAPISWQDYFGLETLTRKASCREQTKLSTAPISWQNDLKNSKNLWAVSLKVKKSSSTPG